MEDEKITALFFERSEQALEELERKYGKICRSLSYRILANRQDAEECVNDAFLGVWNTIPPLIPTSLSSYLYKIVRNTSLKAYERKKAAKRNSAYDVAMEEIEACLSGQNTVEAEIEAAVLARTIERFLDTLPLDNRIIFMRRYWFFDSYAEIAKRVGLREKNVSVRLTRIRKQLKKYLEERGIAL